MNKLINIIWLVGTILVIAIGLYAFWAPRVIVPVVPNVPQVEQLVSKNVTLPPSTSTQKTSNSFPPTGWYVHDSKTLPSLGTAVMLTRKKAYPLGYCENTEGACFGEQINFMVSTTAFTPEAYIAQIVQGGVSPTTQKWSTRNGLKIFSMTYVTEVNTTPTDGQYVFAGNKVYQFLLYPSVEKNRNDFQQVVDYYVKNM